MYMFIFYPGKCFSNVYRRYLVVN